MEELEREPTNAEMAQALGISISDLMAYQTQARPRQLVSLDEISEKPQGDDSLSLAERLPDPRVVPPDMAMLLGEDRGMVRQCLSELPKT